MAAAQRSVAQIRAMSRPETVEWCRELGVSERALTVIEDEEYTGAVLIALRKQKRFSNVVGHEQSRQAGLKNGAIETIRNALSAALRRERALDTSAGGEQLALTGGSEHSSASASTGSTISDDDTGSVRSEISVFSAAPSSVDTTRIALAGTQPTRYHTIPRMLERNVELRDVNSTVAHCMDLELRRWHFARGHGGQLDRYAVANFEENIVAILDQDLRTVRTVIIGPDGNDPESVWTNRAEVEEYLARQGPRLTEAELLNVLSRIKLKYPDLEPHSAFEAALRVTIEQQLARAGTLYVSQLGSLLAKRGIDIRLALGGSHSGLEAAVAALASDICSVTRRPDGLTDGFTAIVEPLERIEEVDSDGESPTPMVLRPESPESRDTAAVLWTRRCLLRLAAADQWPQTRTETVSAINKCPAPTPSPGPSTVLHHLKKWRVLQHVSGAADSDDIVVWNTLWRDYKVSRAKHGMAQTVAADGKKSLRHLESVDGLNPDGSLHAKSPTVPLE